jgi:hypothetical protein
MITHLLVAIALGNQPGPSLNAAFPMRLTANFKILSVKDATRVLGDACGVPLGCADAMASRKVTVFAKNEPAYAVLESIASVLDGEWKLLDGKWRLVADAKKAEQVASYAKLTQSVRESNARAHFRTLTEMAGKSKAALEQIVAEDKKSPSSKGLFAQIALNQPMAAQLARVPSSSLDELARGKPLIFSGQHAIPGHRVNINVSRPEGDVAPEDERQFAFLTLDFANSRIVMRSVSLSEGSMSQSMNAMNVPAEIVVRSEMLEKHPMVNSLAEWPLNKFPLEPSDRALPTKDWTPAAWKNGAVSLAEPLETLHLSTGLPIVAEVLRVPIPAAVRPGSGQSVESWLAAWPSTAAYRARRVGRVLEVRHGDYWNLRSSEIPESVWAEYEREPKSVASDGTKVRVLDDYARFVGPQTVPMMNRFAEQNFVTTVVDGPTGFNLAQLGCIKLYGSLSPAVRLAILAPRGIETESLGSETILATQFAARSAAARGGSFSGSFLDALNQFPVWPDRLGGLCVNATGMVNESRMRFNDQPEIHIAQGMTEFRLGFRAVPPGTTASTAIKDCITIGVNVPVTLEDWEKGAKRQREIDAEPKRG